MGGNVVADLMVRVRSDVNDAMGGMDKVDHRFNGLASNMRRTGGLMTGLLTTPFIGLGVGMIKFAASFEQAMADVNSVANLTGKQFEQVSDLARDIGRSTIFSATEAAAAMGELIKAGVSVEDVLNGAARGATNLAAAAGVEIPQAAIMMANAMNIFSLGGDQAEHIADVYAAAANKSAASVDQLALAMSQGGQVAAQFGVSFEQTVATFALFSDYGLKGSDAGTSFKTMMLSMLNPTAQQTEMMNKYNLAFFDAQGNFIGLEATAKMLQDQLGGLTQEQRESALALIFGSDAVRAADILYRAGAEGIREYTGAVNDKGAAERMAEARTKTLSGALEELKGAVQDAFISFGRNLIPIFTGLAKGITGLVLAIGALPVNIQRGILIIGAFVAAAGPMLMILGSLGVGFGLLFSPIGLVILGITSLIAIASVATSGLGEFADVVGGLTSVFGDAFAPGKSVNDLLNQMFGDVAKGGPMMGSAITETGGKLRDFSRAVLLVADSLGHIWRAFQAGGIDAAITEFGNQWDRMKAQLSTIGHLALDVIVDIGKWVLGKVPELWGWIEEKLGVTSGKYEGGELGGLEKSGGAVTLEDVGVNILTWAAGQIYDFSKWLFEQTKDAAVTLGTILVNVGGWSWGAGQRLYDWLDTQLSGGTGEYDVASGTFGAASAPAVDIPEILVNIGGWALGKVDDIWAWLRGVLSGGNATDVPSNMFSGTTQNTSGVNLSDVPVNVSNWSVGDVQHVFTAVANKIGLESSSPAAVAAAETAGKATGESWGDSFWNSMASAFGGGGEDGEGGFIDNVNTVLNFDLATLIPQTQLDEWIAEAEGIGKGFGSSMWTHFVDAISSAFGAGGAESPGVGPAGMEVPIPGGLKTDEGGMHEIINKYLDITGAVKSLGDEIKTSFDHFAEVVGGIVAPDLPAWLDDGALYGPFRTFITNTETVARDLTAAYLLLQRAKDLWNTGGSSNAAEGPTPGGLPSGYDPNSDTNLLMHVGDYSGQGPVGSGGEVVEATARQSIVFSTKLSPEPSQLASDAASVFAGLEPVSIPVKPDFGGEGVGAKLKGLFGGGEADQTFAATLDFNTEDAANKLIGIQLAAQTFATETFTGILDFNAQPAIDKIVGITLVGGTYQAATFTSMLDANAQPAIDKVVGATLLGQAWDASTYTATIAADNSPAAGAFSAAQGWGASWNGRVFAATITADTSGLDAASIKADQVAQHISDVLHHASPPRKGPLHDRPATFDSIGADFAAVMNQIQRDADSGMGRVAESFGRRAGIRPESGWNYAGGGGDTSGRGDYFEIHVPITVEGDGVDDGALQEKVVGVIQNDVIPALELIKRNQRGR